VKTLYTAALAAGLITCTAHADSIAYYGPFDTGALGFGVDPLALSLQPSGQSTMSAQGSIVPDGSAEQASLNALAISNIDYVPNGGSARDNHGVATVTPERSSLLLLGTGIVLAAALLRRRQRSDDVSRTALIRSVGKR
jgi:hypothetical protein